MGERRGDFSNLNQLRWFKAGWAPFSDQNGPVCMEIFKVFRNDISTTSYGKHKTPLTYFHHNSIHNQISSISLADGCRNISTTSLADKLDPSYHVSNIYGPISTCIGHLAIFYLSNSTCIEYRWYGDVGLDDPILWRCWIRWSYFDVVVFELAVASGQ